MNQLDWNHVRGFLAVLEHGSLQAAARELGLSQPTLGRHVDALEAEFGVSLFGRTGQGMLPSAAARQLAPTARAMAAAAVQLQTQASGAGQALAGTVRISASQAMACFVLPPVLARMRAALPEVQVELVSSNATSNLLKREADIALRMVEPNQGTLIARRLGRVKVGTYAHRGYLQRRGTPRQPADLLHHDLVGTDRDDAILRGMKAAGVHVTREHFALRTDDTLAYWQAVRAGLGIGFVIDPVARTDPDVVPLLPGVRIPPLPLWLVVHRELRRSARIKAVFDYLATALGGGT